MEFDNMCDEDEERRLVGKKQGARQRLGKSGKEIEK